MEPVEDLVDDEVERAHRAAPARGMDQPIGSGAPRHELVEHTGEIRLRLCAPGWPELLVEAGRALAELMLRDTVAGVAGPWHEVEVRSADREALLVDWLNELIYFAESRSAVPTEFALATVTDHHLTGQLRAVPVEPAPSLVKAATLHQARVRGGPELEADVVLDV